MLMAPDIVRNIRNILSDLVHPLFDIILQYAFCTITFYKYLRVISFFPESALKHFMGNYQIGYGYGTCLFFDYEKLLILFLKLNFTVQPGRYFLRDFNR